MPDRTLRAPKPPRCAASAARRFSTGVRNPPRLPARIRLGPNSVGWLESEVLAWLRRKPVPIKKPRLQEARDRSQEQRRVEKQREAR